MAAIIELSTIMSQLEAFQQVRVASAESLNISQMRETSRSLSEAVEKLYWRTKNLNLPEDRGLVVVYEAVTEAVIAEHEFIRAVLKTVSDPGSLRATDALQREGDRMREISGRAFELLFIAYARLDPDLPRAIVDLRAGN